MTANYCLNTESILTAILHDIVENTDFTLTMITQEFGSAIAQKVDKLTNLNIDHSLSTMETINRMREEKATDLLIIKLLDNLHDMQTIRFKAMWKQKEAALQSLRNFLPLAVYIELQEIEKELVELCQTIMNPKKDEQDPALSVDLGSLDFEALH